MHGTDCNGGGGVRFSILRDCMHVSLVWSHLVRNQT